MSLTQRYHDGHYGLPHQNGHTGNGLSSKLDGFMDKRELPMYKDKPYNYAGSQRNTRFYQRRRVVSGAILVIFGLAWWFGMFKSSIKPKSAKSPNTGKNWGSWLGSSEPEVDWECRREKVKEAFMVSWDGYEKYAWGMLRRSLGGPAQAGFP